MICGSFTSERAMGHALLLPARKLCRPMVEAIAQPDHLGQSDAALQGLLVMRQP